MGHILSTKKAKKQYLSLSSVYSSSSEPETIKVTMAAAPAVKKSSGKKYPKRVKETSCNFVENRQKWELLELSNMRSSWERKQRRKIQEYVTQTSTSSSVTSRDSQTKLPVKTMQHWSRSTPMTSKSLAKNRRNRLIKEDAELSRRSF
jgi:hypothetical protein